MKFVDVSKKYCRYFENSDGSTYIPIGLNICFFRDSERYPEKTVLDTYQRWMTDFAAAGGFTFKSESDDDDLAADYEPDDEDLMSIEDEE